MRCETAGDYSRRAWCAIEHAEAEMIAAGERRLPDLFGNAQVALVDMLSQHFLSA